MLTLRGCIQACALRLLNARWPAVLLALLPLYILVCSAFCPVMLSPLAFLEAYYLYDCHRKWHQSFAKRHTRVHPCSPSHFAKPHLEDTNETIQRATKARNNWRLVANAVNNGPFTKTCPHLSKMLALGVKQAAEANAAKLQQCSHSARLQQRASLITATIDEAAKRPPCHHVRERHTQRRLSKSPQDIAAVYYTLAKGTGPVVQESEERSQESKPVSPPITAKLLDMNHVHLNLVDYIWVSHMIGIPLMANFAFGVIRIKIIDAFFLLGILQRPTKEEVHNTVCNMLLETSLATNLQFVDKEGLDNDGEATATFMFPHFPVYTNILKPSHPNYLTELKIVDRTSVMVAKINLVTRVLIEAKLGSVVLGAADVALLLSMRANNFGHPQLHAYANWAIDASCHTKNEFLRNMSVATAYLNHAGRVGVHAAFAMACSNNHADLQAEMSSVALKEKPQAHSMIRDLFNHSKLVRFVVKLRPVFFRLYGKHINEFPDNYSAEAYFLGTVMHSIDHKSYETAYGPYISGGLKDLISPKYRCVYDIVNVVRNSLSEELPWTWLVLPSSYKTSPMLFHQEVYEAARKIDPFFATHMDAAVIR